MELVVAARRELTRELPGSTPAARLWVYPQIIDQLGSDAKYSTWIFRRRPYVTIEGTEKAAIVLSQHGGWTSPNAHNTMRFPRLQVEIFADPPRNAQGNPEAAVSAETKIKLIFDAVDLVFHRPQGRAVEWGNADGTLRVLGSQRLDEIDITDVPEGDGLMRGLVSYGVNLG